MWWRVRRPLPSSPADGRGPKLPARTGRVNQGGPVVITGEWRKSTRSNSGGNCVEVRRSPSGAIEVRNSKRPAAGVVAFTEAEWDAFLGGARDGEFDL